MSIKEFALHFQCSYARIVKKIHLLGLNSKKARNVIWSKTDDILLKKHFENAPKDFLLELFPRRSWNGIIQRGSKTLNLKRLSQDRVYVNYRFFDIWSPESAYICGFILADGHIHLGKNNYLQIEVNCKSLNLLEQIAKVMDFRGKIYHTKRGTCKIQIKNVYMIKKLAEKGIPLKNKTYQASYPIQKIPKVYERDYIRGIIDGDGWSRIDSDSIYNLGVCGTENVVSAIKKRFNEKCTNNNKIEHYETNCWRFNIKGTKALKIAEWLYEDSTIFLRKKYNAYKKAKLKWKK